VVALPHGRAVPAVLPLAEQGRLPEEARGNRGTSLASLKADTRGSEALGQAHEPGSFGSDHRSALFGLAAVALARGSALRIFGRTRISQASPGPHSALAGRYVRWKAAPSRP
jgi:hypothetical protein